MKNLENNSVLITGGTGSFGREIVRSLLETKASRIAIFSRDELKQLNMRNELPKDDRLRFFVGDIRDQARLEMALHGVHLVIHAAALKQVDTGEYNPMEFVKTNVLGSQNLIDASIKSGVRKVVALSTDKASSPVNLYGATKLTADKLFTAANNLSQAYGTSFAVVRYGNVLGSRGSVVPHFLRLAQLGEKIPITDLRMTRFWITLQKATEFVLETFEMMQGGELYVPKIPSMKVVDVARAVAPNSEIIEIGIRPGEKLHEEMISIDDSRRTTDLGGRYVVNPIHAEWGYQEPDGIQVEEGFSYKSDTNENWLNISELRNIVLSMYPG